jgi:hypothetical protein
MREEKAWWQYLCGRKEGAGFLWIGGRRRLASYFGPRKSEGARVRNEYGVPGINQISRKNPICLCAQRHLY